MNTIKLRIEEYLNHLRVLSDLNSEAHREFIHQKLEDHRQYMANYKRYSPYVHPDEWEPS
jgi:hypothetical protein